MDRPAHMPARGYRQLIRSLRQAATDYVLQRNGGHRANQHAYHAVRAVYASRVVTWCGRRIHAAEIEARSYAPAEERTCKLCQTRRQEGAE